ncbi:MAG: glycosyltransferase [Bacteroidota bacterium]
MENVKQHTSFEIINEIQDPNLKRIAKPKKGNLLVLRFLILLGVSSLVYFCYWFFREDHIGYAPLYWLLLVAFGFRFLKLLHEWYHYWAISVPERPESKKDWKVDMITTFVPGEPYDMIVETLEAMVNVRYPHKTYLCDEGNDPFLIEKCKELGVIHSYRGKDKTNAKAGNVNYCLQNHADGEIVVVLDPDHIPSPDFLDRVLPYFKDEEIGYVQCIQAYYNRNESFIAKGAAEQTYHFYGPMMMSMNTYGTAQAIGANCSFRRAALDSIGGHMPGLSEDMHTAMRLHAQGWESVYVPEALTEGQVPETLSGYYSQQLKWSRGSFDLLVHVVPKLLKDLTWRQALHYITIPLFFLSGLIGLIDISVPIISLFTAQSPWKVQMVELGKVALPLFLMIVVIRQFVQRYVLDEHERGFHFMGGALLFATWWVHLTGLIYTILGIKVPYIPTPKGDDKIDEWRLSIPNILVVLLSGAAIWYGLSIDWSPYSMIMASYASINIFMLGFVLLISQQHSIKKFYEGLYRGSGILSTVRSAWYFLRHSIIYPILRNTGITLLLIAGTLWAAFTFLKVEKGLDISREASVETSYASPFYVGTSGQNNIESDKGLHIHTFILGERDSLRPSSMDWDNESRIYLKVVLKSGTEDSIRQYSLTQLGQLLKDRRTAAYLELLPEDSLNFTKEDWIRHVKLLRHNSEGNLLLVWNRELSSTHQLSFPGRKWADYQLISEGTISDDEANNLGMSYFMRGIPENLPVDPKNSFDNWRLTHKNLQGILLEEGEHFPEKLLAGVEAFNRSVKAGSFDPEKFRTQVRAMIEANMANHNWEKEISSAVPQVRLISNEQGHQLLRNQENLYVKGVAYNPSHDWRDGVTPLTRIKLERDFQRILDMGGNAIRRYSSGWYDTNILRTADKMGMNVFYGFWFSPEVDFSRDSLATSKQITEVLKSISKYRDHSSIISWVLGNETYYRLGKSLPPDRLGPARTAYLILIDELAAAIKEVDKNRIIMSGLAHQEGLSLAINAHLDKAPHVDLLGLNGHYKEQLVSIEKVMKTQFSSTPYLVTEFSHGGYWDDELTTKDYLGQIEEPSSFEKANQYAYNWTELVEKNRGHNVGGIAYCWQDRLEGTFSWFGMTTIEGDVKPAYYALKAVWKKEGLEEFPLADLILQIPPVRPGQMPFAPFRVISQNNNLGGLRYKWRVVNTQTQEEIEDMKIVSKWHMLKVNFPMEEGNYRVYLTIYDNDGHAVETSRGFNYPFP